MSIFKLLQQRVLVQKEHALSRRRHILSAKNEVEAVVNDKRVSVFCSNDYLGLSQHPQLIQALQTGAERYGVGGSSSHLVVGHLRVHRQVEEAFAEFLGRDSAILFNNGFMANLGVITTLMQKGDSIFADKFVHASIIDACRASKAKFLRFPHLNYSTLENQLSRSIDKNKLVVTDSVFSMTGEVADLAKCAHLCQHYDANLMVDDAHGIGILGEYGSGAQSEFQLTQTELPILVCPLAKAFGVMGAIVAGSHELIDGLVQFARSYIYTNALPGAYAYAALMSLRLVKQEAWRRQKLEANIEYFRQLSRSLDLPVLLSNTPIQSIHIGDADKALTIANNLLEAGFLLNAMRPPTVPLGSACLRVTLSCLHTSDQIDALLHKIKEEIDALSS